MMQLKIDEFNQYVRQSLKDETFLKLSVGDYQGTVEELKKLYAKKILIKKVEHLSFVYRYKTKDITKNYSLEESVFIIDDLIDLDNFRYGHLCTTEFDVKILFLRNGEFKVRKEKSSVRKPPSLQHDKVKNRKIKTKGQHYLRELNITDKDGNVYKSGQDKYKQINHYIEILSSLLDKLPKRPMTNIVDMGAGKGYLTFALYDYLNNIIQTPAHVTGVEYRKDLVKLCNEIAERSNFEYLQFKEGTIENYISEEEIHVLIALHACDTATDEAIYKGITGNADLIVVAPCCHKQIRREIEKNKQKNELDFLTKHGIFLERQAEMVTDGIRALVLEYFGYSTKVFEFVSDAHTPKNVLIVGEKKTNISQERKEIVLEKIKSSKSFFGIKEHYLEGLMKI